MNDTAGFPWDVLGIAPTRDPKVIRAAYAARLKRIDARTDPAAFQRLRCAYEQALGFDAPAESAAPVPAERNELADEIDALIAMGDPQGAVERLAGAEAGALGFDDLAEIEQRLLVLTPDLARVPLLALVRRFDWHHATHPLRHGHQDVFEQLDQRLWLEELRSDLERKSRRSIAAGLLIKGPPAWSDYPLAGWYLVLSGERRKVIGWLDQIEHAPHAEEVFNPARLRSCRLWLRRRRLVALIAFWVSASPAIAELALGDVKVGFVALVAVPVNLAIAWGCAVLVIRGLGRLWLGGRFVLGKLRRLRPGVAAGTPRTPRAHRHHLQTRENAGG